MRMLGTAVVAAMLATCGAEAQTIRAVPAGMIVASDFEGPYDDLGPELPPREMAPSYPPRAYPPRAYAPPAYAPPAYDYGPPVYAPPLLPIHEIYRIVREGGYSPLGAPQQRGAVYTIAVLDLDGEDGRLVIDARTGRIIRFMPAFGSGGRRFEDVTGAYHRPSALPPARQPVPVPKPRMAAAPPAEKSSAVASQPIAPAPAAAMAAAPATPAPAPKAPLTLQPTQAMPPAQGVE